VLTDPSFDGQMMINYVPFISMMFTMWQVMPSNGSLTSFNETIILSPQSKTRKDQTTGHIKVIRGGFSARSDRATRFPAWLSASWFWY